MVEGGGGDRPDVGSEMGVTAVGHVRAQGVGQDALRLGRRGFVRINTRLFHLFDQFVPVAVLQRLI